MIFHFIIYRLINQLDVHALVEDNLRQYDERRIELLIKNASDKINNLEKAVSRIEKIMLTSAGVLITGMASVIIVLITR